MRSSYSVRSSVYFGGKFGIRLLGTMAVWGLFFVVIPTAHGQLSVSLTASDASGSSSFNTAGHWSNGLVPQAGLSYSTSNFGLRTPNSGSSFTFGGSTLTVATGGEILMKGTGTTQVITANTILAGGIVVEANSTNDGAIATLAGSVTVNLASEFEANAGETVSVTAPIVGSAPIYINGGIASNTGTVLLNANNTGFSGGVTLYAGTLQVANSNALGTGNLVLNGGSLTFAAGLGSVRIGGLQDGTATVNIPLTDSAGAAIGLMVGSNNQSTVYSGVLSGPGSLNMVGSGGLTLNGASTFTGNTLISSGTLIINNNSALQNSALNTSGTGTVTLNVTTPTIGGLIGSTNLSSVITSGYSGVTALTLNPSTGAYDSYSGVIADGQAPMALIKTGAGTQVLAGTNSYTGLTTISAGALSIATTAALPGWNNSGSYSVAAGAALAIGDAIPDAAISTILGTQNFAASAALGFDTSAGNRTFAGPLANTSNGALGLTLVGGKSLTLTGSNTYTGTTTISGGTLQIGNGSIDGSIASSSGIVNNSALLFNVAASQNYGNAISGSGAVSMSGSGTLLLTGTNTYTGPTTISGGTLQVGTGVRGQDGSLATSGIVNNAAIVYNLSGSQTAAYALSGTGSLVKTGTGTLLLGGTQASTYSGTTVIQGGTLKLGGVPQGIPINVAFQNATVNGYTGTGPLGASGTAAWNVFASGVANSVAITTNTLSNLINATSATVAGTKLSITAGTATVFSTSGVSPAIYNSYGLTKSSVTFSMSGLATQPYTVYALSSYQSARSGSFVVNGSTNQVASNATGNAFVFGADYTSFSQVNPTSGAIAITAAPTTNGNEFDFAGFQFVPDVGSLPSGTALSIAAGSTLDLNGLSQTVSSLSNYSGSGGTVTSSGADVMTLTLAPTGSTTFGGLLQNGSGTLGLAISGTGTETLTGNNTYSGGTTLQAGTLNFAASAALGSGAATFSGSATLQAGVSGTLSNAIALNAGANGTFDTQANAVTLNGVVSGAGNLTKVGSGTLVLAASNTYTGTTMIASGVLSLANTGALAGGGNITFSGGTLQYSASNASDISSRVVSSSSVIALNTSGQSVSFNSPLAGSNTGGLNVFGNGVLILNASNAFSGNTLISAGTLQFGSGGAVGSLPSGSTITNNGALVFFRNNTVTQGTDFGSGLISGTGSLTQLGNGALVLNASNTYSGTTNISAGSLVLNSLSPNTGALPNTSGVAVAGGATLLAKGNTVVGGGLTVNTSGIVNLIDGTVNTLAVAGPIGLSGSTIDLELGGSGSVGAADSVVASGAATLSGINQINVSAVPGQSITSGSYTLISASGGLGGSNNFILVQRPAGFFQYNLIPSNNTLTLSVSGNPTPVNAYWTGAASQSNSAANNWGYGSNLSTPQSNWSTASISGSDTLQVPGAITNVYFTAANAVPSGGTVTTQLDGSYGINSLTFDTSAATNTISSVVLNANGYTLTTGTAGVTVGSADTSNTTISGNGAVQLLASQNWANNNNSVSLTVATAVNGTAANGNTQSLTFSGTGGGGLRLNGTIGDGTGGGKLALVFNQAGTTVLAGANTYSGGTTIGSGTLQLGSATALVSNGPLTFAANSTGVLQLFGNNNAVGDLNTNASVGTPIIENGSGSAGIATLSVNVANADTFAGTLLDGGVGQFALLKSGTGSLTLTGSNSFTGGVTINAGTLQLGSTTALNSTPGAENAVVFTAGSSGSLNLSGNSVVIASLASNTTTPGAPLVQNAKAIPATLSVGNSANASSTFAGTIQDGIGGGALSLIKAGTGTLALNGSNGYSGGTTIVAGTLQIGNVAALGSATTSVLAFSANSTGTLALNGNSITLADLRSNAVVGTPVIQSGSSTAGSDVLTVNTINSDTFGGVIQDGSLGRLLALTKTGSGALTLSGNNTYSGATVLNQGTLNIAASNSTSGGLTFGATVGSASAGTLNVTANATFGSLTVQTNTSTPNTIAIANGNTLTINGAVSTGVNNETSLLGTGPTLTGSGGTLNVNGNFIVGVTNSSNSASFPSIDLSGLSAFNLTSTNAGFLRVGFGQTNIATLTLAASNTINVATISVGDSNGGNYAFDQSVLNLGTGSNVLQAGTINISNSKGGGVVQFASSSSGSLTISGPNGAGVANITIANANNATYQGGTNTNSLSLAGHNATVNAGNVKIGVVAGASGAQGPISAAVTFDTGTFNAATIIMAQDTSGATTNTINGAFTLGTNPASTGVLNVTGTAFYLADNVNTVNVAVGKFVINGGTANLSCPLTDPSLGTGNLSNTTLTLNGGVLNMNNNSIGGSGVAGNQSITNLNFWSGTLENVTEINGGSFSPNSTLVKTTTGTLIMAGTNTYTGGTVLNAGMLVAADGNNDSFFSALGLGPVTLNGGALAAGSTTGGTQGAGSVYGLVTAGSGAHTIAPGAGLVSGYGTLNLNGGLTTSSSTTLAFNFNLASTLGLDGSGDNIYGGDLINLNNATLDASAGGNIVFGAHSAPTLAGDYRLLANLGFSSLNVTGLNLPVAPSGEGYQLSTTIDPSYLDLIVTGSLSGGATWNLAGSGSWTTPGNWIPAVVPSGGTLTFPELGATSRIAITLDGPQSAGALVFSSSEGYRLAAGNSGTLALTGSSSIMVLSGSNGIAAPVELVGGSLIVSASNSAKLTFFGNISDDNGHESLTLNGDGTGQLALSGTNSYGGGTNVVTGTLILNGASSLLAGTSLAIGSNPAPGAIFSPLPSTQAAGLAPVPEPGTFMLMFVGTALAGLAIWRRRMSDTV